MLASLRRMSHNRKLTHWFAPSSLGKPSSKGASADSKPPINSSQSVSRREDHRAGPYPPTARHRSLNGNIPKSIPTGHPIPRVSRITDLADSGVETDSSVELVSTRAMSSRQIPSSQPTPFRTVFNGKRYVDPVRKGVDSNAGVESSKDGKSPIVIELSSDAMTPSTVSPKSSVSVSDDNSDAVSRLKRRTASPSSAMSKRQRVSESLPAVGSGPGKSSPGERARRHVEVTLTMRPPPRKDDRDNDAMVWVPTPSQSASRNAISNSKSKSLTTDRSQDTPKTFTEPQTDTAAEIIARMKADASAKPSAISSDTESEDNRAAIAAALADDTSDNDDGDDAAELLFGQKRLPSIKQASCVIYFMIFQADSLMRLDLQHNSSHQKTAQPVFNVRSFVCFRRRPRWRPNIRCGRFPIRISRSSPFIADCRPSQTNRSLNPSCKPPTSEAD